MNRIAAIVPGTRIGRFTLGECLHTGETAALFEVTAPDGAFPMVMKVPVLKDAFDSAGTLLAFEMEGMILARLHGPHVPRFVAAGDVTTVPYVVSERVDGASLDRREERIFAPARVAAAGAAICDALHAVHAQHTVHLDLKPDNVIVKDDGCAVLLDFALAHHRHLPDLMAEEMRYAAGSAPYISPEQLLGSRSDARSDLFSLGAVLYELATDRLPFGCPRTLRGLRDRLWRNVVPLRARDANFPGWLQEVILRCLEPDPERRYQSAAHVAFDLRHPSQVALTERAARREAKPFSAQLQSWWNARHLMAEPRAMKDEPGVAPVIMVAVDTRHLEDARQPELQRAVARILSSSPEFRLVCVSVIPAEIGPRPAQVQDAQVENRVRLHHWIRPLKVPAHRVSLHVLEAADPAPALLEFARRNNVDLIVLGAPGPEERALAWWRSAASSVTANAMCSVHVVRRSAPEAVAG